jgi:RimJ/RimL family protein N-acetyltransferase
MKNPFLIGAKEGVLRQENYRDGRYWGTMVMGILHEEWERGAGRKAG